jgi:tetratricopeptide (TPR) repeat protein
MSAAVVQAKCLSQIFDPEMDPIEAFTFCQKNWRRPFGLVVSILFSIVILVSIFLTVKFESFRLWQWAVLAVVPIVLSVIWWTTTRLPRVPKGQIGFAVAIRAENQNQAKKLKADFIKRLREMVGTWTTSGPVCFLDLGESPVESLIEHPETYPRQIHSQTKCHFLVWGDAKERDIDGPKHVLELEGSVTHAPVTQDTGARISEEFRDLFPRRVQLAKEKDLFSFQFTAEWIDAVAQYLIGIASYVSGDMNYAESVFLRLYQKLHAKAPSNLPQIAKIRTRLPSRIAEVYKAKLGALSHKHRLKRSRELLVESEVVMTELEKWEPSYYGLHLNRAICHFELRRDVASAFASLKKCEQIEDGTWLWSKAFLEVYTGKLDDAYRTYQKAFAVRTNDETVPIQCEEFVNLVLDEEPEKGQLYYSLGLINLRGKRDLVAARRDLVQFLDWIEKANAQYPHQVAAARKWIAEIDVEMAAVPANEQPVAQ